MKGWGNGLADAGSRNNMPGMRRLAAAFGISLTEVLLGPDELSFSADVLEKTREWRTEQPQFVATDRAEPRVQAASLLAGASCNSLGDRPVPTADPPIGALEAYALTDAAAA